MIHLPISTKQLRLINRYIDRLSQTYLQLKGNQFLLIGICLFLKTSALSAEKAVLMIDSLKDKIPIEQKTIHLQADSTSAGYLPVKLQIGEEEHTLLLKVELPQLTALPEQEITVLSPKEKPINELRNEPVYLTEQQPTLPTNNWVKSHWLDQSLSLILLLYGFIYAIKEGKAYWRNREKASEGTIMGVTGTEENIAIAIEESTKTSPEFSMEEIKWLVNLQQTVEQNMSNIHFDIGQLASDLAISSRHLNRQIRKYTGFSTNQYIQEIRLTTAKKLLVAKAYKSVKAVAYEVGYKDVKYFGQLFKKRFGHLPSTYFKKNAARLIMQGI